jgi:hypothetical protein
MLFVDLLSFTQWLEYRVPKASMIEQGHFLALSRQSEY